MQIAVSGTHRTGKTTLVEELRRVLPGYVAVDEPYHRLAEEGHDFAEVPSLDDFELQLELSIESLRKAEPNRIFDRCPVDLLVYWATHPDSPRSGVGRWLPSVREAMRRLDLVVFVPIERPDRVPVADPEDAAWRRRVDAKLREILFADPWDFEVDVLEVTGPAPERVRRVLAHLGAAQGEGVSSSPPGGSTP